MKQKLIWGLTVLNVALVTSLAWRIAPSNTAVAQAAASQRPGECILVPGEITGSADAIVYILDTTNGTLGAMNYDSTAQKMQHMPPISLSRIFDAGALNSPNAPLPGKPPKK